MSDSFVSFNSLLTSLRKDLSVKDFPFEYFESLITKIDSSFQAYFQSESLNSFQEQKKDQVSVSSIQINNEMNIKTQSESYKLSQIEQEISNKIHSLPNDSLEKLYYWTIIIHQKYVEHPESNLWKNSILLLLKTMFEGFGNLNSDQKLVFLLALHESISLLKNILNNVSDNSLGEYFTYLIENSIKMLELISEKLDQIHLTRVILIELIRITSLSLNCIYELKKLDESDKSFLRVQNISLNTIENLISFSLSNLKSDTFKSLVESKSLNSSLSIFILTCIELGSSCLKIVSNFDSDIIDSYTSLLDELNLKVNDPEIRSFIQSIQLKIISSLTQIGILRNEHLKIISKKLYDYLNANINLSSNHPIITHLSSNISEMLSSDCDINDLQYSSHFINIVAQDIFVDTAVERYRHRCKLLANIAQSINDREITQTIAEILIQVMTRAKKSNIFDSSINLELVKVALLNHGDTFYHIVDEIFTFYKDPQESSISKLPSLFGEILSNLATQVVDRDLIINLLNKSLDLFITLGKKFSAASLSDSQEKSKSIDSGSVEILGVLLNPIAHLAKISDVNTLQPDIDLQNKFKSLWFIVVIFGLCIRWKNELGVLSKYTPVLSEVNSKTYYEGLKSHIESLYNGNTEFLSLQLFQILKSTSAISYVSHLDFPKIVYILTIYHLESFRVQNIGSLRHLLTYFEDNSFDQGFDCTICLKNVSHVVFQKWISSQKLEFNQSAIEDQVIALFSQLGNRTSKVRQAASDYLEEIKNQFSFVMWSPNCISAYLEMLKLLNRFVKIGPTTNLLQCQLPDKSIKTFFLPQEYEERTLVFNNIHKIATNWIIQSLEFAPNAFKASLEEYLLKCQHSFDGNQNNYGETLAILLSSPVPQLNSLDVSSAYKAKDQRHGLYLTAEMREYSVSQSTAIKSYHYGQVKSLKNFVGDSSNLESYIIENLTTCAKKYKFTKSNDNLTHFNDSLQLATAFLITSRKISIPILQKIIWEPIECFTPEAMESGIYCWHWISTSRNGDKLEISLLNEMYQAWSWVIDERKLLFTGTENDIIPLDLTVGIDSISLFKEFRTFRLWINFLAERFQIAQKIENSQIQLILSRMIIRSLEDRKRLSSHRNSFGCRIRLCFLALIMAIRTNDAILACSLRQKVYDSLIDWFEYHTSWYTTEFESEFSEDMKVLQELIEKLKSEQKFAQEGNEFSGLFDPENASIPKSMQLNSNNHTSPQISNLVETLASTPSNSIHSYMFPKKSFEKIDLLLLLLSHEYQRQIIFHNPRNDTSFGYRNLSSIRQFKNLSWDKYLSEAWSINPRVAIQCGFRFPYDPVYRILTKRVLTDIDSVIDIPEATFFLITKEHVAKKVSQLSYLSIWAPTTLSNSVRFLNTPFVHDDNVRRYALRSLRFYSPKYIIFYTSQLLQCLRHDNTNELREFFLELVNKSAFFAHRLIWNCRTEIFKKEELDKEELKSIKNADFAMSEICEPFEKVIMGTLDSRGKQLYEEEFSFFQKMTDISGELVQFEKGSVMRKEKLVEFLQRVRSNGSLSKHLYLPSNTESRIVDFDPHGARVLKSSKKVPIMVPFHVKMSQAKDIGDDDIFDDSKSQKQLCIFKMGDDCRQDVLALQLIALFKAIFERAGLPLYLFPYRVITTGRGTGIIEVVPNTKSRHDIGALTEGSLYEYFVSEYGHPNSPTFQNARKRFIESMAAYSVVSYILNIKDRHNGNILIDTDGHIIHIDFGFLFDTAPGGKFSIEKSAFKLNTEMLRIMGENPGFQKQHSEGFLLFKDLVLRGFLAAREYMDDLIAIVEVMLQSELPCFVKGEQCIKNLKYRLAAGKSEEETVTFMNERIHKAYQSIFSFVYDKYQEIVEKINM